MQRQRTLAIDPILQRQMKSISDVSVSTPRNSQVFQGQLNKNPCKISNIYTHYKQQSHKMRKHSVNSNIISQNIKRLSKEQVPTRGEIYTPHAQQTPKSETLIMSSNIKSRTEESPPPLNCAVNVANPNQNLNTNMVSLSTASTIKLSSRIVKHQNSYYLKKKEIHKRSPTLSNLEIAAGSAMSNSVTNSYEDFSSSGAGYMPPKRSPARPSARLPSPSSQKIVKTSGRSGSGGMYTYQQKQQQQQNKNQYQQYVQQQQYQHQQQQQRVYQVQPQPQPQAQQFHSRNYHQPPELLHQSKYKLKKNNHINSNNLNSYNNFIQLDHNPISYHNPNQSLDKNLISVGIDSNIQTPTMDGNMTKSGFTQCQRRLQQQNGYIMIRNNSSKSDLQQLPQLSQQLPYSSQQSPAASAIPCTTPTSIPTQFNKSFARGQDQHGPDDYRHALEKLNFSSGLQDEEEASFRVNSSSNNSPNDKQLDIQKDHENQYDKLDHNIEMEHKCSQDHNTDNFRQAQGHVQGQIQTNPNHISTFNSNPNHKSNPQSNNSPVNATEPSPSQQHKYFLDLFNQGSEDNYIQEVLCNLNSDPSRQVSDFEKNSQISHLNEHVHTQQEQNDESIFLASNHRNLNQEIQNMKDKKERLSQRLVQQQDQYERQKVQWKIDANQKRFNQLRIQNVALAQRLLRMAPGSGSYEQSVHSLSYKFLSQQFLDDHLRNSILQTTKINKSGRSPRFSSLNQVLTGVILVLLLVVVIIF